MSWVGASAKEIARAVRRGDVSATQVVADHLDYARTKDAYNAFRLLREAEAVGEAEQVDEQEDLAGASLAGVPVAVKENTPVAGVPTWRGSAVARGPVAETDHEVVRRLRGAGAVVIGTTRMPELGLWGTTDDPSVITRNPWDPERTPGGSSGGSGAAVAAGLVPIAHGTDGLGSVRIPAACCGLVGLKPGRGVVPSRLGADSWFGLTEHGILATTVADAAAGFAVIAGQRPGKLVEPARLRVAVATRSPVSGVRLDAPNRAAVTAAARMLLAAGHDAVRAAPTYPTWLGFRGMATWTAAAYREATTADLDISALQPRTRRKIAMGRWAWQRGYVRERDRDRWRELALDFFQGFDLMLAPALAGPPPPALFWSRRSYQSNLAANLRYSPYAAPWNIAGLPALVVPVGQRPDGLPAAVQLVGRPGSERLLLAAAGQFEQATPWPRHATIAGA
ncbi:amidase [Natronosporangium hydrolyticum]|uniref:Amidase n=1 Tax=Natronosporangium hydrolyticum TaxID=2811111 RepID=A0A895YCL3_9ACTN|nr:amidase [Natronosporangium hydrolyticum]QSB13955.1 amidase [Natronosporangium hydrolyticum]